MKLSKWDRRFLELAAHISTWSKDPSTKVGAVIVDDERTIVSTGFNGLPRNMRDLPDAYQDKNKKYKTIIHGEMNAILCAPRTVRGSTLYTWPFAPCSVCASMVVQAGIRRVVAPLCTKEPEHWIYESLRYSEQTFIEAGVELITPRFEILLQINGKEVEQNT